VVLKEAVGLYHERVAHRVAQANKVMGLLKRWGIMAKERDFQEPAAREALLAGLGGVGAGGGVSVGPADVPAGGPLSPEGKLAAGHMTLLWRSYDEAVREAAALHRELVRLAKQEEVVVRWQQIPGIGWIRGLTLLAYLDTPWRFKGKRHLWKYMGIGLTRAHSGNGYTRIHVDNSGNKALKDVILGAAETVLQHKRGELYRRYEYWRGAGQSYKNARRNVARDIAAALWAMWKTGGKFDERLLGGKPVAASTEGGGL